MGGLETWFSGLRAERQEGWPRAHLQVSKSYHKEEHQGRDGGASGGTGVSAASQHHLPGFPYLTRSPQLCNPSRQGLHTPPHCTGIRPLRLGLTWAGLAWKLSCFGQVAEPLSPIFPICKDHTDVPAWALYSLLPP